MLFGVHPHDVEPAGDEASFWQTEQLEAPHELKVLELHD
jgi:hypothetical protein